MLDESFRLSQPLSKLYSRLENSKTDKGWVTSRCGSIPATNRSGVLRSARTCCGFSGIPRRRRAAVWHSRGSGESFFSFYFSLKVFFTRCDFVVWAGLVGGGRRVVINQRRGEKPEKKQDCNEDRKPKDEEKKDPEKA